MWRAGTEEEERQGWLAALRPPGLPYRGHMVELKGQPLVTVSRLW